MKILAFLASALVLGAVSIANAEARSVQTQIHHVLKRVQIDGQQTPYIGVLNVDFTKKQIEVQIVQDPCGQFTAQPGEIRCMAAAFVKETLRAPLQNVKVDNCNTLHLAGRFGMTLDEQSITKIEVADHTGRRCLDRLASEVYVKASKLSAVNGPSHEYVLMK